jgi:hypothetical protein
MGKYRKFLVHTFWVLNTVVAFWLGAQFGSSPFLENFVESSNLINEAPNKTNSLSLSLTRTGINSIHGEI